MTQTRLLFRLATIAAIVLLAGAVAWSGVELLQERGKARQGYEQTRQELQNVSERLSQTETRLRRLTTSVEAVELEARYQLRMIKPGERLVIVRSED